VDAFCGSRVPSDLRDQIRIEYSRRGKSITIVERRPPWNPEEPGAEWTTMRIAQLRYDASTDTWSLYSPDSNDRWWLYQPLAPTPVVGPLLSEIDRDPTGIFWG
jgi:hypothetical protein